MVKVVDRSKPFLRRFSLTRSSTCVLAGLIAVGFAQTGLVNSAWTALSVSLILAAIAVTQGPRPASSNVLSAVSFLPLAVSLAYGLPGSVYLVSSLPLVLGIVSEERRAWSSVRSGIAFAALLTALGAVWIGNHYLVLQSGWDTLPATLAAATVFYLIYSLGLEIPSATLTDRGILKQWSEAIFRNIPVWLLIPAALGVVSLLSDGASLLERVFGSVLFLVGVVCLSRYHSASGSGDLAVQTAVETLTVVTGAKNHDSPAATRRLGSLARATAKKCACLEEEVHTLDLAAVLHDIGKVGVPDRILMKPGAELPALWKAALNFGHPELLPQDTAVSPARRSVNQDWMDEESNAALRNRHSLQKLSSTPHQLVAFYDILRVLGADLNFDKSLKECVRILCRAMPCDKAGIFILDGESFVLMQGAGFPDHCVSRLAVSSKRGLLAECVESKQIMIASGAVSDSPDGHTPRYLDDVRSSLVAPLIADDRVIGTILLCCTKDNGFELDQCQLLMSLLTGKVASTVLSSRTLRRIYLEAETDTVTGLPNTRAVVRKLETELQRAQRKGETVAVLFIDLNDLKPVNDSFGHAAGDTLLLEVGRALKRCLRPYDFLGRVGGDEFLAIVPGVTQDQLSGKMQVLKSAIATTSFRVEKDVTIHTSVSVGAAVYPADTAEAEELVYLSDKRMYQDKQRTKSAPNWTSQTITSPAS